MALSSQLLRQAGTASVVLDLVLKDLRARRGADPDYTLDDFETWLQGLVTETQRLAASPKAKS